ncbi:MAG: 50S ribosomal protein L25, partial [Gammaproteobacteria bacterium]|nr:50S ribosomal protein L25 [Gammaproteobacteria bacterium]
IKVGEKSQAAILKDVQRHPAKNQILHMDFQRIVEDEEIKMSVPLHFLNEDIAIGVKQGGGKVSHLLNEVEVVCLPKHLPEYLEVDIAELELDAMLKMSDIPLPEGVSIPALAHGPEADHPIVNIHVIREVVIEEEEAVDAGAVPVEGEEAPRAADEADDDSDSD